MTVIVIHVKAMQHWWFVLWRCYILHLKPWTKQFYLVLFHKGIIYMDLLNLPLLFQDFLHWPSILSTKYRLLNLYLLKKIHRLKLENKLHMTVCTWNVRAETENSKYWYVRTSHTCKYTSTSTCLSLQDFMWKQYSCRLCAQFLTFTFLTGSLCPGCPWECCFNGCRANFAGWVTLTGSTFSMPGEPCSEREYSERVGAATKSFKEIKQSTVSRLHKYPYQKFHHLFMQQKIFKMNNAFVTSFSWQTWRK